MRTVRCSSCLLGGVSAQRVSAWGCLPGGGVSQHALRQTPSTLWTEFLTHACKNITLADDNYLQHLKDYLLKKYYVETMADSHGVYIEQSAPPTARLSPGW